MKKAILVLLAALVGMFGAASDVFATGTNAGDSVTAAYFTSTDTIPQSLGRLSLAYVSGNLTADTLYKGPSSTVSRTVDTGWDLTPLNAPADSNSAHARDTVSYGYYIKNTGNAAATIDVAAIFASVGSDTNWGSSAYKVFYDLDNDGSWDNGDTVITSLTLAADGAETLAVVALVPYNAAEDDSSGTRFYVSNRAPATGSSVTGDMWEAGAPLGGNDNYDTQVDTVVTRVVGPNVRVSKSQILLTGRARPGDTIEYSITIDNDGSDSASNVVIYDAISQNATYVPNSADSALLSGQTALAAYEATVGSTAFDDTGSTTAKIIRWSLSGALGVNSGDDKSTVDYTGVNDSGRIGFRVRIN